MIKKIDKLILSSKDSSRDLFDGLVAIAKKIKLNSEINFLSIDLDELESLTNPEKVGPAPSLGRIEVNI